MAEGVNRNKTALPLAEPVLYFLPFWKENSSCCFFVTDFLHFIAYIEGHGVFLPGLFWALLE